MGGKLVIWFIDYLVGWLFSWLSLRPLVILLVRDKEQQKS